MRRITDRASKRQSRLNRPDAPKVLAERSPCGWAVPKAENRSWYCRIRDLRRPSQGGTCVSESAAPPRPITNQRVSSWSNAGACKGPSRRKVEAFKWRISSVAIRSRSVSTGGNRAANWRTSPASTTSPWASSESAIFAQCSSNALRV